MTMRCHRPLAPRPLAFCVGILLAGMLLADVASATSDLDRGRTAVRAGRFADAIDILRPLCVRLEAASDQGRCWFYLGVAWQKRAAGAYGDEVEAMHRRAIDAYQKIPGLAETRPSTKLDFSVAPALNNLARLHADLGERERADQRYRQAIAHADETRRAGYRESYGDFLADGGDWKGAAGQYRRVVALVPESRSAHHKLVEHFRARDPEGLVRYLHQLLGSGQVMRGRETALAVLTEDQLEPELRRDLLALVAVALSQEVYNRRTFPESDAAERLRALVDDPVVGQGAREILRMHERASWQPEDYGWWSARGAEDNLESDERRQAFRAMVRSMGRWYQRVDEGEVAEKCYRLAGDLVPDKSDPEAVRALADLYLERGEVDKVRQLVTEYEPQLQRDASRAAVQEEAVLGYRETASRMLAHLGEWGDGSQPASAFYQLERTAQVVTDLEKKDRVRQQILRDLYTATAKTDNALDVATGEILAVRGAPRFDPGLAELWARGLEAQGRVEQANEVRLETAEAYRETGHVLAAHSVLESIEPRSLSAAQRPLLANLQRLFPAEGRVVRIANNKITVDLGVESGIEVGDVLEIFREGRAIFHPETGEPLPPEEIVVATIKVTATKDRMSEGKVRSPDGKEIRVSDKVRMYSAAEGVRSFVKRRRQK